MLRSSRLRIVADDAGLHYDYVKMHSLRRTINESADLMMRQRESDRMRDREPTPSLDLTKLKLDPHWTFEEFLEEHPKLNKRQLEEYWKKRRWEHPHMLHTWFESSYLPCRSRPQYRKRYILDYERCTPQELKRFVINRGLSDPHPGGVTLKYYYIRVLESADERPTFRFLDLLPQLRDLVYGHLLSLTIAGLPQRPTLKTCHPNILRACHQTYREAKHALYDDNAIECTFEQLETEDDDDEEDTSTIDCRINGWSIDMPDERPDGLQDLPEYLLRCSHLWITVTYKIQTRINPDGPDFLPLNNMLCGFAWFLMGRHRVRRLDIDLDVDRLLLQLAGPDVSYKFVLYPLLRLRNIHEVDIFSYDEDFPACIQPTLSQTMCKSTIVMDTLKYWRLLIGEANLWTRLELASGNKDCDELRTFRQDLQDETRDLSWHILRESCASAQNETAFRLRLFRLAKRLSAKWLEDVARYDELLAEQMAEKRMARIAFEDDPTSGVLTARARFEETFHTSASHDDGIVDWMANDVDVSL